MLQKLISHMDQPVVHESLLGLLQTFTPKQSEDSNTSAAMVEYAKIHLLTHTMSNVFFCFSFEELSSGISLSFDGF